MELYAVYEGVGCEACHGAGSHYYTEAIMRDAQAAMAAGLKDATKQTCLNCHENAHDKPFDYDQALKTIAHPTELPKTSQTVRYKTPLNMAISPNGLGIVWKDGRVDQVLLNEPGLCFPDPADVALTPDGKRALVTSSGSDRIAVVDVPKLISMRQEATDRQRERVFPNHLGKPTEFIITHIPTGILTG